ncbi:hypothetical protein BXZ70DRAFT_1068404 [Cristinia sonorae]|uniref:F-box domain-containing protein n=1 Tax=Cristinia sonorae TaxID=1940300 RepID=A0A8K0UFH5_9AGAR|nr:hypothetical protein BXZ70DRAFT_1068404 [Cristinia sonorae]
MPQFADLPDELVERIMLLTNIRTLGRVAQVSKGFKTLMDQSLAIRYKMELDSDRMVDGPPSGLDTSTRLTRLQERRAAWKTFQPTKRIIVPHVNHWMYAFCDTHIIWRDEDADMVRVFQIPSSFRGMEQRSWSVSVPFEDSPDEDVFEMLEADPGQDLLALVKVIGNPDNSTAEVILRRLSNGENHPESHNPILHFTFQCPHNDDVTPTVRIGGNYIYVCAIPRELPPHRQRFEGDGYFAKMLVVMNWKTGEVCLDIVGEGVSCAFLDEHTLLVGHDGPQSYVLSVLDLRKCHEITSDGPEILSGHSLRQLRFPDKPNDCDSYTAGISVVPSPTVTSRVRTNSDAPFYISQDRAIRISLVSDSDREGLGDIVVFISSTVLRDLSNCAGNTTRPLDWDEWGPQNCIVSPGDMAIIRGGAVHGSSVAIQKISGQEDGLKRELFVYRLETKNAPGPFVNIGHNHLFASSRISSLDLSNPQSWALTHSTSLSCGPVMHSEPQVWMGTDCIIFDKHPYSPVTELEVVCF